MDVIYRENPENKPVINKIKAFDIFKKVPEDLKQSSNFGAIISILSAILIIYLFFNEFQKFLEVKNHSEMFVDQKVDQDKLVINMDIYLHRIPCDIVSLDVQDVMGNHDVNVGGNLIKRRLDSNGQFIKDIVHISDHSGHNHDQSDFMDISEIKQRFIHKEGCQLIGSIKIKKVPGNFHISSHAFGGILSAIFLDPEVNLHTLDLSHTINHLSFGEQTQKELNTNGKNILGSVNPLDGSSKIKDISKPDYNIGVMNYYYLNVVPTIYENYYLFSNLNVYQFTSNHHSMKTQMLPALYFKFDFSPISVKFYKFSREFFHFLTQTCAIIGGIFTIATLLDSVLNKFFKGMISNSSERFI